ncbi:MULTISPECIES: hypothetical protein [unclassified Clostridium]|uniref:hypothetical protein n=1 Tax=unclassified Clostridium TaxID=2614128 RepID=UPI0002977C3B|nr:MULTISPECIES: hypothetical protein [unclassified Clostridium]EKQ54414.1 MAG: hypothetical protein A370_03238 [Clostridium sp. Maddingley MBC34-26]
MKRKSTIALILAAIVILAISLIGCGSRTGTRNNSVHIPDNGGNTRGNMYNGIVGDGTGQNSTGNTTGGTTNNNANTNAGDVNNTNSDTNTNNGANNNNISDATRDRIKATADSIRYSASNFTNDIKNAGYNVTESANTKKNYFKGNETDYLLGGDVVRLYEYNSPAELEGDMNRISPNGLTINGTDANYTRRPYYYRKGNTLIVYEGNEPAYIDEFRNMYGNTLK